MPPKKTKRTPPSVLDHILSLASARGLEKQAHAYLKALEEVVEPMELSSWLETLRPIAFEPWFFGYLDVSQEMALFEKTILSTANAGKRCFGVRLSSEPGMLTIMMKCNVNQPYCKRFCSVEELLRFIKENRLDKSALAPSRALTSSRASPKRSRLEKQDAFFERVRKRHVSVPKEDVFPHASLRAKKIMRRMTKAGKVGRRAGRVGRVKKDKIE